MVNAIEEWELERIVALEDAARELLSLAQQDYARLLERQRCGAEIRSNRFALEEGRLMRQERAA